MEVLRGIIFLVKLVEGNWCGGFGRHYFSCEDFRINCESEFCRSLS